MDSGCRASGPESWIGIDLAKLEVASTATSNLTSFHLDARC